MLILLKSLHIDYKAGGINMSEKEQIGHIIKIIDEYSVIIDLGNNIVNKNDMVYIYEKNNAVKDLKGNIIGRYDICKGRLCVTEVYNNFSVCEALPSVTDKYTALYNHLALSPLLESSTKRKKLNIDPNVINKIKAEDNAIRIGDIVKIF